jgi:hypothetical protein
VHFPIHATLNPFFPFTEVPRDHCRPTHHPRARSEEIRRADPVPTGSPILTSSVRASSKSLTTVVYLLLTRLPRDLASDRLARPALTIRWLAEQLHQYDADGTEIARAPLALIQVRARGRARSMYGALRSSCSTGTFPVEPPVNRRRDT